MSSPKKVFLAVIGAGGVGQHFLSQLSHVTKLYPYLSLVLISRTKKCLFTEDFNHTLSLSNWASDLDKSAQPLLRTQEILDYLSNAPGRCILVDNTSSQDIADTYPNFLGRGISIVTPNKKAFSGNIGLWRDIFSASRSAENHKGGLIYHESSVGAGLPIISTLKDLVATGDELLRIQGIFSGTMSYLFNGFMPAAGAVQKWSNVVKEAKRQGYTEPDPRDDLNGMDVARKVIILARIAGLEVESTNSFSVHSLIPKELESVESADNFLMRLPDFDEEMKKLQESAEGGVVRYVASIDFDKNETSRSHAAIPGPNLKVGLETVPRDHPLATLKGSDNLFLFYTKRYGENPLIVQGAGAGGAITAMGVSADLIKVLERL